MHRNDERVEARESPATRSTATVILLAYLGILALLVFLPSGRGMDLGDRINLDPFATIDRALQLGPRSGSFRLLVGNIAAFVPLGFLLPLVARSFRSPILLFLAALTASAAIELGQLAISNALGYAYRSTDVDDVILNVCGALVGYLIFGAASLLRGMATSR